MPDESQTRPVPADPGPRRGQPDSRRRAASPLEARVERALTGSLWLTIVPVVILVLAALGAFVYGGAVFIHAIDTIARHPFPVGHQIGLFLLDIDLFLIGATLLISAIGLYELFVREIRQDEASRMPGWLQMHDLNDLKGRVISMIVLVLAVSFAELGVAATSGRKALELGGGIALVIVALTVFQRFATHTGDRR
jgi:uncharacterized protein (TIGR00645 family)